jgi:hypothetical protein
LKARLNELSAELSGAEQALVRCAAELAASEKIRNATYLDFIARGNRIRALEADLRKYGGHTANCAYHLSHYKGPVSACDCGWTEEVTANKHGA